MSDPVSRHICQLLALSLKKKISHSDECVVVSYCGVILFDFKSIYVALHYNFNGCIEFFMPLYSEFMFYICLSFP